MFNVKYTFIDSRINFEKNIEEYLVYSSFIGGIAIFDEADLKRTIADADSENEIDGMRVINNRLLTQRTIPKKDAPFSVFNKNELESAISKAEIIGALEKFKTIDDRLIYVIKSDSLNIVIIPDNIFSLDIEDKNNQGEFYKLLRYSNVPLKLIGGMNILDYRYTFSRCEVPVLDITNLSTARANDMDAMFRCCKSKIVGLRYMNTKTCTSMESMFEKCECKELDLSRFDTSKVETMRNMFNNCKAKQITFSTSFDTSMVSNMASMFRGCKLDELDLSMFRTDNLDDCQSMFNGAEINTIDLSNFIIRQYVYTDAMFAFSDVHVISNDERLLRQIDADSQFKEA